MEEALKKQLLEQAGFKCKKCFYYSPLGQGLEVNKQFNCVLCSICNTFAPQELEKFNQYLEEKINWQELETFRRFGMNKGSHLPHKRGMISKAKTGMLMTRPAFGYNVLEGKLIVDQETSESVRDMFNLFLEGLSLNRLSKQFNISVNGIKKILKNFTYIGKIKFNSQIHQGNHEPIISPEVFNRVQQKFESSKKSD
jgi:transcription initiation factor IIE alpha subunit